MNILHKYNIREKHKSVLKSKNLTRDEIIKYVENIINVQNISDIKNNNNEISNELIKEIENQKSKETEKKALVKIRLGHSKLRDVVIKRKCKCEICGLSYNKLLIISHIKPWAQSDSCEKLDYENILLLCSMHDALFDKGLISFDNNGKILISKELNKKEQQLVNINTHSFINVTSEKQKEYLKYHREKIFIE